MFSKNFQFTRDSNGFKCSNSDPAKQLEKVFEESILNMEQRSLSDWEFIESGMGTQDDTNRIIKNTISFYLAPTSQTRIFGKEYVVFNGKLKPTILPQQCYSRIKKNWSNVLSSAGIIECVDRFKVGTTASAFDCKCVLDATSKCGPHS